MTALESGSENVPPLETVTERLLREEKKLKGRETTEEESKLLVAGNNPTPRKKAFPCHYCGKLGHYKRDCRKWAQAKAGGKDKKGGAKQQPGKRDPNQDAMLIGQALTVKSGKEWLVDSGATSHMSNCRRLFTQVRDLEPADTVTLHGRRKRPGSKVSGNCVELDKLLQNVLYRRCSTCLQFGECL